MIVGAGSGNTIPGPDHAGWRIAMIEKDTFGGCGPQLIQLLAIARSLNLSQFVARKIWRRRGTFPLRCRAHRLQRRRPLRGLLVPMATIYSLLQTVIN